MKKLLGSLLLLISGITFGQTLPAGPQVQTFFSDVDDTEQPYGLYLPRNYDASKKYPLVIMLHGAGDNHRLSLRRVFGKSNAASETDVEATRYFPAWEDVDYIVASPLARGTMGYQGIAEKDVLDVLAAVKQRFSIDEDRIYLTGLSMGGGGTLWVGLTHPDIWAALAPVCPAPPQGTERYLPNALNIPMHFFHGDKDGAVNVSVSRDWTKKLKESGVNVAYTEYPGVNHNSWENAYEDGNIFKWFSQFKRNAYPDRVRFSTATLKYNKAYWVTLNDIAQGTTASIDVKFTGPNQLEIISSSIMSFTLNPHGHAQFKGEQPLQVTLNGKKLKIPAATSFTLTETGGKWTSGKYEPSPTAKKPGSSGPIGDVFSGRHIYVYGTSDNPNEEELKNRRDMAELCANWSMYRGEFAGRIMVFPRVLADKELRPSDFESSNLVLFGTKESNSAIAKYADKLPIHLNPAAVADHGLLYVFPNEKHYVAVSSGLPWWKGQAVQGFRFMSPPLIKLMDFKDFLLFKDSAANIIAEGYFDSNWKLSEKDQAKLKDAAAVTH